MKCVRGAPLGYTEVKGPDERLQKGEGTKYGTYVIGNDAAKLELQQEHDKAEQKWRFRHVRSRGHQVLTAVPKRALDFAQKASSASRPFVSFWIRCCVTPRPLAEKALRRLGGQR